MSRSFSTLLTLIVAFVLLLQIGCQEQAKTPKEPATALAKPKPIIVQEQEKATTEADQPAPKITFENVIYDFGEVPSGTEQLGQFKFTNTGDGLLKITEVKRCCGVVAELVNNKKEYSPGENGIVKVEYHSGVRATTLSRQIYVISNDKENPNVELTIKAKIVPKVAFEPQRLQILLKGENAVCPEITLTSLDDQPFSIISFRSTRECITADIDFSMEATKFAIQPKVDFEKLQGASTGLINISLTHPQCDRVSISFSVLPNVTSQPRSIIVLNAQPKKPVVKKISVLSNYGEDFEIESVSSENGFVKVLSQQKIANRYQLEVEVTPPAIEDKENFTDELYVSIKGGEKLSIRTYGRYSTDSDQLAPKDSTN